MNKTQKGAWFTLGVAILLVAFGAIIFTQMFAAGETSTGLVKFWSLLILLYMIVSIVFLCRKQSPSEPGSDERDNAIKKKAVLVSFVSVWILLVAASIAPSFVVGDWGKIPVYLLPIINLGVFLIIMLIYSIAILIQYGRKGEK